MARTAASIQAEITVIETQLSSITASSISSSGASVTYNRTGLEQRLDRLYQQLGRANGTSPMFVRGVVKGL